MLGYIFQCHGGVLFSSRKTVQEDLFFLNRRTVFGFLHRSLFCFFGMFGTSVHFLHTNGFHVEHRFSLKLMILRVLKKFWPRALHARIHLNYGRIPVNSRKIVK